MTESAHYNFELEIISRSDGSYRARVVSMPYDWPDTEGPAIRFHLPYEPDELAKIMATLRGQRPAPLSERQQTARTFGQQLYQLVFAGEIDLAYRQSQRLAAEQNRTLRLQLVLDQAGRLANFPWEFLHDEKDYLTLSRSTPVVRYPRQMVIRPHIQLTAPIRVLVMVANPVDMPPLNVEEERRILMKATQHLRDEGLLAVEFLEEATLLALQRRLREADYHIFHYIGHSGYDEVTGVGWLSMLDRLGEDRHEAVKGVDLARELGEENTIRLVVMNSCHGARQDERLNPAGGIASSLVVRGIPAVVANQFEVSNEAATLFTEEFYTAIAEGLAIDAAVSEGRRAVSGALQNTEWATPVLYLRAAQDRLFDFDPESFAGGLRALHRRAPRLVWGGFLVFLTLLVGLLLAVLGNIGGSDNGVVDPPVPPVADIQVSNMQLSTNRPAPGEFLNVSITVENLGPEASPPLRLEFLGDDQDPRTLVVNTVPAIPSGETRLVQIPFRFPWFGTFIARAFLDPDQEINDPNRRNNVRTLPAITSDSQPFVVNFSDALPDGERITNSQIVRANTFNQWGFTLEVLTPDDGPCVTAAPWFKVQPDGVVTLGTGLPDDAQTCADLPIALTLLEQRDAIQEGTTGLEVTFYPGEANNILTAYTDRQRTQVFDSVAVPSDSGEPVSAALTLDIFDRQNLLAAEIDAEDGPLLVTHISFSAP